ncbi:hypothetical protein J5474_01060 [Sagittula sp. M10.9X]|uniref:Uncharacterized protein n=2 Tax=Sagittula salina TaxID=2820268 RepID=A0A940RZK4_9RHOB|nr:hypothetical protein [Sagittula salina]
MTHAPAAQTETSPASIERTILMAVALFVALVALATWTWGLPALAMIALACVPVMYAVLLLITVGK